MKNESLLLGLGTAAIGRPQYINIRQEVTSEGSLEAFRSKGLLVLEEAYQQGVRYFDTAPGYGFAEQLLIDWLATKNDPEIEIATKWGYTYVADFNPDAVRHEVKEHSLEKLNEQWRQSKNLIPQLTTYQIHSATLETGVLENERILYRLAELKDKHNLLIGISTTGANQLEVIKKALDVEVENASLFDTFQVTYNIFDQSLFEISTKLANQNKRIIVKEALANGRVFSNEKYPHYENVYGTLQKLADQYGVGVDAIALRFCMDSINAFKVLSGAANKAHLSGNIQATQFELTAEDISVLKAAAVEPSDYWKERKQLSWN